ncbi:phage tail tape measure protein [Tumebacillus permanentifrigoris]|uniref:TP901 family phage tail tape measure protein n=1 Tax=Tumebacillus permanentifrigoris TaxID=378543 RepID=A0A316D4R2_9BACL|nr:phage tail tape measure protein [Tumebacillus permanentifrigoris]PWK05298.1 TP901 family phage tail tape measure protein [Tumebacillus permanentifrigoris]
MATVARIRADLTLSTGQFKRSVEEARGDMQNLGAAIRNRANDFTQVVQVARQQAEVTRRIANEAKQQANEQSQAARDARQRYQDAKKAAQELAEAARHASPEVRAAAEAAAAAAKQAAKDLKDEANLLQERARAARQEARERQQIASEAKKIAADARKAAKEQTEAAKAAADAARRQAEEQEKAAKKAADAAKKQSDALEDTARKATMAAAVIAVGVVAAIEQYARLEQSLANLKSVTGASVQDLDAVRAAAQKAGPAYGVLSTTAVDAVTEFVKAGVDLKRLAGGEVKDALALMVAGELEVGEAANYASAALNTYKKEHLALKTVADIAAGAANASATSVKEMTFANSMLGPVGAQVGQTFEDVNTVLALFANNGLRGSDAGTSLKTTILQLVNPTDEQKKVTKDLGLEFFTSAGKMKTFAEIADMLHNKLGRFNDQAKSMILATLAGTDGVRALSILANTGASGIEEMNRAMKTVTADETAKIKIDSLKGSFKQMGAEAQVAAANFGQSFAPAASVTMSSITALIQKYNDLSTESRSAVNSTVAMGLGFGGIVTTVLLLVVAFKKLTTASKEANLAIGALARNPILLAATAVIGVLAYLGTTYAENAEEAKKFAAAQDDLNKTLSEARISKDLTNFKAIGDEAKAIEDLMAEYEELKRKKQALSEFGNGHMLSKDDFKSLKEWDERLKKIDETLKSHGVTTDDAIAKAHDIRAAMGSNVQMMQLLVEENISDAAAKQQQIAKMEQLRDRYQQLSSATSLSASETAELRTVTEQLKQTMPQLIVVEDERGRAIITNNEALNERVEVEKAAAESARISAVKQINEQMAVAQAYLNSAQAVIEAYDALTKARAAFLADSVAGIDPTLSDEKSGRRLFVMADQAAKSAEQAQKTIPGLKAKLSKYKDDLASVDSGAYAKLGQGPVGEGKDPYSIPDDKKPKEKDADKGISDSYRRDLDYSKQLLETGEINQEQYIQRLKDIRESYADWLKRNTSELYSITNEIEHEAYGYSKAWIEDKKQSLQDAGESSLSIAKMEMDGWQRVLQRTGLLAADRAEAQKEYDRSAKEYRAASFADSEKWIGDNEKKMSRAGASELDIAKATYDAWARVNAKRSEYNPEDQVKATEQLAEAQVKLTDVIASNLKKARELDRDQDMAAIEERAKAMEEAIQSKIEALDKEAQAQKYLLDLENERKKLADLEEQRNRVASDVRFSKIEMENGVLVDHRVADTTRLAEIDKQISEQKAHIADMERDEATRQKREQYEKDLKDTKESNERLKAAHKEYWDKLVSDEQINADTRSAIQKNGLDTTLANVRTYLGEMQAEYDAAKAKIMSDGGIFSLGSGTIKPAPVFGPPAPPSGKTSVADIKARMAARSDQYKTATPEEQQRLHDENVKDGTAAGGKYDPKTGQWIFHSGVDRVPGTTGADVPGVTLQAGERVLSVSQNRTFEAFMTAVMNRESAMDRAMRAVATVSMPAAPPQRAGIGNVQVNVTIPVAQEFDADRVADIAHGEVKRVMNRFMNGVRK